MEQLDAKVEQYRVLAKMCTSGPQLKDLIVRAISEPGLFVFGEMVALPGVDQLRVTDAETVATLELFAFGTWEHYVAKREAYLQLDDQQVKKLKQLSMCTLAQSKKTLQYDALIKQLDLASVRELEDFVIKDCIYTALLKCKLDQCHRCLHVQDVQPRDVRPEQLPVLVRQLEAWLGRIGGVMAAMQSNVDALEQAHRASLGAEATHQKEVARVVAAIEKQADSSIQDSLSMEAPMEGLGAEAPGLPALRTVRGQRTPGARVASHGPDPKRRR